MGLEQDIRGTNNGSTQGALRKILARLRKLDLSQIFANLTNSQAKQIANAIANITGGFIRIYGYDSGQGIPLPNLPLLVNGSETIVLKNTSSTEVKTYPVSEYPLQIKTKEDMNLNLGNGKYLSIYAQVDGVYGVYKLLKNVVKDTLIGNFQKDAYFQYTIQDFGSDLVEAQPYNVTIENNTSFLPKVRMESQYAGTSEEVMSNGKVISFTPYQNWDYAYSYWGGIDMTNESQSFKMELRTNDANNSLLGTGYAYAGNNYPNTNNWIGQIQNGYGTRNFKIVISNI